MREVTTEEQLRWMTIHGGSGFGKSRLIDEFLQRIDAERRGVRVYKTSFPKQNQGTDFAPLSQIVRQRFAIKPSDNVSEAKEILLRELVDLVEGPALHDAAHLLGALLHFSFSLELMDPDRFNQRAFMERAYQTCINLVQIDAVDQPVVMVIDNADVLASPKISWLENLLHTLADTPVFLLLLSQNELTLPSNIHTLPQPESMHLNALKDEEIGALLEQFIHAKQEIPSSLYESCIEHARGNPRNTEDILRLLIQKAVIQPTREGWAVNEERCEKVPIPTTSNAIAQERLSSLGHRELQVLEAAATLGVAFWKRGVLSILRATHTDLSSTLLEDTEETDLLECIRLLTDLEIIRPVHGSTLKGEEEFNFINAHERTQILRTMDPVRIAHLSRLAAQWMATATPTESSSWHVLIAECLQTGERIDSSARHLIVAGDLSLRAVDHGRAMELYERATSMIDVDNATLLARASEQLAWLKLMAGEYGEAEELYLRCHGLAQVLGNPLRQAFAITHVGKIHRTRAQYVSAGKLFSQALDIYERERNLEGIAAVKEDIGKLHWHLGAANAYDEAARYFKESLTIREEIGDRKTIARCLSDVANVETLRGNVISALMHHEEALSLFRKIRDRRGIAITLNGLAGLYFERDDAPKALELWEEALDLSVGIGDRTLYAMVRTNLGECFQVMGSLDEAATASREAVHIAKELSNLRVLAHALKNLAAVLLQKGEHMESASYCDEAIDVARTAGNRYAMALGLRTRAQLQQISPDEKGKGNLKAAQSDIDECIQILEEIGNRVDLQKSLDIKASISEEFGDTDSANSLREEALKIRAELGHSDAPPSEEPPPAQSDTRT